MKDKKEILKEEKNIPSPEIEIRPQESQEALPKAIDQNDNIDALRKEVERKDADDSVKLHASSNLKALDEEKKIKELIALVKSKGIDFAVDVAKKMNDPYLLDKLHDKIIEEKLN